MTEGRGQKSRSHSIPTYINPRWLHRQSVQSLIKLFNQHTIPFRFVGGCVRNGLLNLPVADIDAATPLEPEQIIMFLEKEKIKALPTGVSHGTVTAIFDNEPIEITTLRRDVACDGRHADVSFTKSWVEDAKRRDFTMNAIYCDGDGKLYDDVGGIQDALQGIVRFIGDPYQRIHEDYLRLLRFFRFHAYYGQAKIDPVGLEAAEALASNLIKLSGERIQAELFKILQANRYLEVVDLIIQHHILDPILPIAKESRTRLHHFDSQWQKLPQDLSVSDFPLHILRLGLMLDQRSDVKKVVTRLKLSRQNADWLKHILHPPQIKNERDCYHQLYYQSKTEVLLTCLIWASRQQADVNQLPWQSKIEMIKNWYDRPFLIRGQDLIGQGLQPGPDVSKWLKQLEIWWLDQDRKPNKKAILKRFASR